MTEFRRSEVRAGAGRRVSGVIVRYSTEAIMPWGRETFEPGSLTWPADIRLNLHHDRANPVAVLGRSMTLDDGPNELRMSAELPDTQAANDALKLIAGGIMTGISAEFIVENERKEGDLRIITAASLRGVSLVDAPAYPDSLVQLRRRGIPSRLTAKLPTGKRLGCRCQPAGCSSVEYGKDAFKAVVDGDDQVLAVKGSYGEPVAARSRGGVKLAVDEDGSLDISIDLSADDADAIKAMADKVPVVVRPYADEAASVKNQVGEVMHYESVKLRGLIIGTSDLTAGLTPVAFQDRPAESKRRRVLLW